MPSWMQRSNEVLRSSVRRSQMQALALAVLLGGAGGCATTAGQPTHRAEPQTASSPASLIALYNAAIVNSAVFRAEHQNSDLWPVTGSTQMGSLMSCECPGDNCSAYCGLQSGQPAPTDIWVSPADQVLQFCQSFPSSLTAEQVILKLQQLQGLPPQTGQEPCTWQILQVTIDNPQVPEQFFRPCPDPDPTTTGPCPATFDPSDSQATVAFQAWMAGQAFSSWQIPGGYPWTHLGYTYNWDPDASSIVGTSEYVIPRGTTVQVVDQVPAIELCTNNRLKCS